MLKAINNIIAQAPLDPSEKTRLKHFSVFVFLGVATMACFAVYNFLTDNLLLGSLVFLSSSCLLFGWLLMCYLPMGKIVYRFNGILYGGLLLYMLVHGGEDISKIMRMFTFPLIVFFLTGKKEGLVWSVGLFLLSMFFIYIPISGYQPHHYSNAFIIRFATVYLIITIISFWFEFFRDQENRLIAADTRQPQQGVISKEIEESALRMENRQMFRLLEGFDVNICVVDVETHHILHMNKKMKKVFGGNLEGKLCWQVLCDASAPCAHCSIPRLRKSGGTALETVTWEAENPIDKRWYLHIARMIIWSDQRLAKLQIAFDITEQKRRQVGQLPAEKSQ